MRGGTWKQREKLDRTAAAEVARRESTRDPEEVPVGYLPTSDAVKHWGKQRYRFISDVQCLGIPYREISLRCGGSPRKYYPIASLDAAKKVIDICVAMGHEEVLRRLKEAL